VKQLLVVLLLFLGLIPTANASHIIGGEFYYDYLGNNVYRLYIVVYRDCASTGAPFDDPLIVGVFDSNNNRIDEINIGFPGSVNLPVIFNNPCVTPPGGICAERAIYTFDKLFPPTAGGYTLAYQRCCRGPNITNLNGPDDTGLTWTCFIPGTPNNNYINSSARFTNYPPLVICNNEDLFFDHSATDPDGDILTYELVTPNAGANSINPQPNPIPSPPYPLVSWGGGFNSAVPLGAGSTTTINPNTGALFVDANLLGLYVVGIRVNEWRNGVIISSTTRDFLFRVVNCIIQLTADVTEQEDTPGFTSYCQGLTFTFDNQSSGASSYQWDFGVNGITTDVSTAFEPTYTFPAPGTYNVMLIANPGWPCTDTSYVELTLNNPFSVDVIFEDSACFINNSVDFQAVVNGPVGTQLTWDFGPNGNPQSATTLNVNDVTFDSPTGNYVKLVGETAQCVDSVQYPIFFFNPPTSNLNFQPNHECLGYTQTFLNASTGGTYSWDFGVNGITTDVSTLSQPTYTYPGPGTYNVTLIAEIVPGCADTLVEPITVYEPLVVGITHPDSLCITDNSVNFVGNVSGPSITQYMWNFGSGATPATSTSQNVNGVNFANPGNHLITLTASFLTCSESASTNLFLYREPTIDFSIIDALRCAPHTAYFVSNCTADTEISYMWDFGDGGTSNEENPLHLYPNPGQYSVTLEITTDKGCIDTLSMEEIGAIVVHPNPTASFTIDKDYTDICNSAIQFTDNSSGGLYYSYNFDDVNGATSSEQNPIYAYAGDGFHTPILVVANEFGCTDTARASLFIEPFTPYIPNTFTPDGDENNNQFEAVLVLEAVEWKMEIFNRWGQLVFTTTDQQDYWDGTYNGMASPEGVYIYKVTYVPCGVIQDKKLITGHVSLLR